jgi:hypothetical protein
MRRFLLLGFLAWLGGTVLIRLLPSKILPARPAGVLLLYGASFVAVFLLVRRVAARLGDPGAGARAIAALVLPTLVLDAPASAFFSSAYPNLRPESAGTFVGWMLICSAGALAAAIFRR